jgi:hypothetical protein
MSSPFRADNIVAKVSGSVPTFLGAILLLLAL